MTAAINAIDVSVLVVTYNHEAFIAQALESVLAQSTSRSIEIIISEDQSTDRTRDIVEQFARRDPRIRLILSERNIRSNEVVARAIATARGRYVCILDGDDYWVAHDKIERQADILDAHPSYSAVFHNALVGNGQSTLKQRWTRADEPTVLGLKEIWAGNPFATCAGMLRRDCLKGVGDWYHDFFPITDWPLYILCAEQGAIAFFDEIVGFYRLHAGGAFSALRGQGKLEQVRDFYQRMARTPDHSRRFFARKAANRYFADWAKAYAKQGELGLAFRALSFSMRARLDHLVDRQTIAQRIRARLRQKRERWLSALLDTVDRLTGPLSSGSEFARGSEPQLRTRVAFVGCGFVADFYGQMLKRHPELELVGVADRNQARAVAFALSFDCRAYPSLAELLNDASIEVVVNLTNPHSHFDVSKASLEAGKHVYSEKPLAMNMSHAEELVLLAEQKGLLLSSAPCSILGESAQALAKALRDDEIGRVRVVYAEIDDGPVHQMEPQQWTSPRGTPWPWKDEFSVGCTMEHAGYYLTWLVALFGPARAVTAFSTRLVADKNVGLPADSVGPDFSVACIEFDSGIVARLTCSIVAPVDHSLRIIGDKGVLSIDECWHYATPVRIKRFSRLRARAETYAWVGRHWLTRLLFGLDGKLYTSSPRVGWRRYLRRHEMDYLRGVQDLAAALRGSRPCKLSARFALHVNEIALAIQQGETNGRRVTIRTSLVAEQP